MTRYKKTNSVVLSHIEEKNFITVEYPADSNLEWKVSFPLLLSFEETSLYVYNIEKNSYEEYICPLEEEEEEETG